MIQLILIGIVFLLILDACMLSMSQPSQCDYCGKHTYRHGIFLWSCTNPDHDKGDEA